ncbi:hypothetical protein BLNAU_22232 [Blattamonas nauphoetae]|uniref:Uncharacterized protein n=1 Tax=Blattamonas nauphoetae TaxID=2049346 RepID=A0ABQ9WTL0_9EUKA|nr:hypothetical protein BLNAU_22232 [Blattamonas nauphoetae]
MFKKPALVEKMRKKAEVNMQPMLQRDPSLPPTLTHGSSTGTLGQEKWKCDDVIASINRTNCSACDTLSIADSAPPQHDQINSICLLVSTPQPLRALVSLHHPRSCPPNVPLR